ncbi:bZIP transcription factor HapX [Diplocarpon rosae]|nr:bZIP transcription factor HapX [Diplocarpon rosae]
MASPAVSTASSAGSPPAIAPAPPTLASRNINAANLNVLSLPQAGPIMGTRKEWIIPPRPKPGRKPATDTPPTKRKAQNRAAQRAFRERRAARVGELEEQLDEVTNDHQRRESDLRNKIGKLEADIERFSGEVQSWRVRCDTLDRIAEYERKEKEAALAELAYLRHGSRTTGTDAVPLPPRHPRHNEPRASHEQEYTAPETEPGHPGCGSCTSSSNCACADQAMAIATVGCGNCGPDTHCECLEETIKAASDISSELKRPHSPSDPYNEKRQRHSEASTPLEIDFTSQFSSKPVQSQEVVIHTSHRQPGESCGFCEEGTYCILSCADTYKTLASHKNFDQASDELSTWLGRLHATPPAHPGRAPMEVEAASVMGVLKLFDRRFGRG